MQSPVTSFLIHNSLYQTIACSKWIKLERESLQLEKMGLQNVRQKVYIMSTKILNMKFSL